MIVFGKKKQKNDEPLTVNNRVFGPVRFFANWFTVEPVNFELWNNEHSITLRMVADDINDPINELQEKAGIEFKKNILSYSTLVENQLQKMFNSIPLEKLRDAVKVQGAYFSKNGKIGVALSADLDEGILEECGIGPDDEFGIEIAPEIKILPSNEEFLIYFED